MDIINKIFRNMKNELFLEQFIQLDFKLKKGYEYSER